MESPTNPCMRVINLKKIASIAHKIQKDIIVVVDNTFQTPYFQVNIFNFYAKYIQFNIGLNKLK